MIQQNTLRVLFIITIFTLTACNGTSGASTDTLTPSTNPGSCPLPPIVQLTQPSFPIKLTLAENTQGEAKDPVGPTTIFKSTSTFHAVVHVDNAPTDSKFGAVWFSSDTGGVAACNSAIDAITLDAGGTRNIDFSLPAEGKWPAGTYQVQIIVNSKVAAVQDFSVK